MKMGNFVSEYKETFSPYLFETKTKFAVDFALVNNHVAFVPPSWFYMMLYKTST